jgi:glucose-6-phosphate-specific signal transduction histidine kinase
MKNRGARRKPASVRWGLIGTLSQARVIDRLASLIEDGTAKEELVTIWKRLRPKAAHATPFDIEEANQQEVEHMLNQIKRRYDTDVSDHFLSDRLRRILYRLFLSWLAHVLSTAPAKATAVRYTDWRDRYRGGRSTRQP